MVVMNDFKKEYHYLKKEIDVAVISTFESGWYILGKNVAEFEKNFAGYLDAKYCIGVANGLEALQIALMALHIGKGDEVITVSNSAVATTLAITSVGATPVFVDIDEYFHLDMAKVEQAITKKTKAILPVHLFGQTVQMSKLNEIADKYNLFIIEDACQAHGATYKGKKAGSMGDIGCFSFYPTKNLGTYGDGGAIVTDDDNLYKLCKMFRNYGQTNRYEHEVAGLNSRLDEVHAAILNIKLKSLDSFVTKRNKAAGIYNEKLSNIPQIKIPKTLKDAYHAYHLYVIEAERRDELKEYLKKHEIESLIHYPIPIHKQNCYKEYNHISLPVTEEKSKQILSLPIHPFITEAEVHTVCTAIKNFYTQ